MTSQAQSATDTDKILKKVLPQDGTTFNTAVITFGRFQPPHLGHKKMIEYVYRLSKKEIPSSDDKIVVAKKYIMEHKEEVVKADPSPDKEIITDELKTSGGYNGDPYVFVSRKRSTDDEKRKFYNPTKRSKRVVPTFDSVMEIINKSADELSPAERKEKELIKKTFSNPFDPEDKIKLMKLQYHNYENLHIVDPTYFFEEDDELSANKNIQLGDIVPKLLENNYNRIVIVVGEDRKDAFDFVAKSAQSAIPLAMKTAELVIVAIGRGAEDSDNVVDGLSATKVRKTALNIDDTNYDDPKNNENKEKLMSYLIPTDAPEAIKTQVSALLPLFVRKIHQSYKPLNPPLQGGSKSQSHKKKTHTRKKQTPYNRGYNSQRKSIENRRKRKTRRYKNN